MEELYEYKVIPFRGNMQENEGVLPVSKHLEDMINDIAAQSWEFIELGDVTIQVNPGCIAGLLGGKISYIRFDQLIFRRLRR